MSEARPRWIHYSEVDAAPLVEQGILDVVSTPVDGGRDLYGMAKRFDRVARVSIKAAYQVPSLQTVAPSEDMLAPNKPFLTTTDIENLKAHQVIPQHNLIVEFSGRKGKENTLPFLLKHEGDGGYAIATVAGSRAGLAPLSESMSAVVAQLLSQSIDGGQVTASV